MAGNASDIVHGRLSRALTAALMAGTMLSTAQFAATIAYGQSSQGQVRAISIPAGPLTPALNRLAAQTGLQIVYDASIAAGRQTNGVSGSVTPNQALTTLLSGTGVSFRYTGTNTVTIVDPNSAGNNSGATVDGAIALDTIDVSGGGADGGFTADTPYETPGSVSHISSEQLDRVPAISPGDVFINTPGVINAGNRVGTSINPNIRGLQGMGRVVTTIDGARQGTSTYRGYIGNRDESYVDPDMIGGIDITKGPSEGTGVGGIGGSVNFRTLEASDIVKAGESYGTRIKTSIGTNTVSPRSAGTTTAEDRPSLFGSSYSGSVATAAIHENYEFVTAYSKRKQGNYFVGTKVPKGITFGTTTAANATVLPGQEAFNTSENTESFLAKGKVKWGDGQSLELGYIYYSSHYGEINELNFAPWVPLEQEHLTHTQVDTYTARYRYKPSDNPLLNFRANAWLSDIKVDRGPETGATIMGPYSSRTMGGDIGNVATFNTAVGEFAINTGLELLREQAVAEEYAQGVGPNGDWESSGPWATRLMTSATSSASLKPWSWLTLSAGARYDYFKSESDGTLSAADFADKSGSRVSPHAGIVVTPLDGLQLFATYTEGYRPPSLRESHWKYRTLLQGNPDLKPELSQNHEIGFNVLRKDLLLPSDSLRFKFAYFDNYYDDYIIRARISGTNNYRWDNIDQANYRGFEISGGYDARHFFFEGAFTKYANIEYCVSTMGCSPYAVGTDYSANYVPPEYSGSVTAGVRLFDEKLTLGGRLHFASQRSGGSLVAGSNIAAPVNWPAYRVFDVFGSYALAEDWMLNFSVENITDEYYFGALSSVGIASPGRTARVGLTTRLGSASPLLPDLPLGRASEGTPGSNWTGLYLGGHLGYSPADILGTTIAGDGTQGGIPATESANLTLKDLTRGGQIGFNYQFQGGLVVGVEGDISLLKHKGYQEAVSTESAELTANHYLQARTVYELDWMATLRGRLGFQFNRMLIYGTAGLAFVEETETRTQYQSATANATYPAGRQTTAIFSESDSAVRRGWTVGGGFEYALTNNWSLKGEYLYSAFGAENFDFPEARAGVTQGYSVSCTPIVQCIQQGLPLSTRYPGTSETTDGRKASNELDLHSFKLGINYRF